MSSNICNIGIDVSSGYEKNGVIVRLLSGEAAPVGSPKLTVVDAYCTFSGDTLVSQQVLVDKAVENLEGITREQVIAATKREVLRELTVTLVANGVL